MKKAHEGEILNKSDSLFFENDAYGYFPFLHYLQGENIMSRSVKELESIISIGMSIDEIIGAFEKWYRPMEEEDALLFETGTFRFTGEKLFYFSLTKQFPSEDDEYYQIHMDILYTPDDENKKFSGTFWDETGDEIMNYIKNSDEYEYAQRHKYKKIEIYMDET